MSECEWTREVSKQMVACNATVLPYVASRMQPSGYPDRIIVHRLAGTWFVEFKDRRTPHSAKQKERQRELAARGANVLVARRLDSNIARLIDERGEVVGEFDCTGRDLLVALTMLRGGEAW